MQTAYTRRAADAQPLAAPPAPAEPRSSAATRGGGPLYSAAMRTTLAIASLVAVAGCGGAAAPLLPPRVVDLPIAPLPRPKPAKRSQAPAARPVHPNLPSVSATPKLERVDACATRCAWKSVVPPGVAPKADDKAPVWMWEESLARGAEVVVPGDAEVDMLGVVLAGDVAVTGGAGEKPLALDMWQAFHAAGGAVSLRAREPSRVVLVAATSGTPLAEALAKRPVRAKKRAQPLASLDFTAQPDLAWGGGAYHVRLGFDAASSPRAALEILYMGKGAGVARHAHEKEWEALALLSASGEMAVATGGASGDARRRVVAGAIVTNPAGAAHELRSDGNATTLAVQVYAAPGPEQRFKKLAGAE